MARFKQQVPGEESPRPQASRPAGGAHARHAAPAVSPRPQASAPASRPRASAPSGSASASSRPRGSRFADAARATSGSHRFSNLDGTSTRLVEGQVPVVSDSATGLDAAPRPIGVDPAATGAFHTISGNQGAVVSTRETASRAAGAAREAIQSSGAVRSSVNRRRAAAPTPKRAPKAAVAGIVVAVVIVIVLAVVAVRSLTAPAASEADVQTVAAQTSAAVGTGVEVAGSTYETRQGDQGWELVRTSGEEDVSVAQLSGTPVALCLSEGTLVVPENLSDGTWDVICYVVADGSTATQLLGDDGNPVVGSGELTAAEVDGGTLVLTDSSGAQTRASLS